MLTTIYACNAYALYSNMHHTLPLTFCLTEISIKDPRLDSPCSPLYFSVASTGSKEGLDYNAMDKEILVDYNDRRLFLDHTQIITGWLHSVFMLSAKLTDAPHFGTLLISW